MRELRVQHRGVLRVSVTEVVQNEPEVVALVRQIEATGGTKCVRVNTLKASALLHSRGS